MRVKIVVDVQEEQLTWGHTVLLCTAVKQSSRTPHPCRSRLYIMWIFGVVTYAIDIFSCCHTHTHIHSWPLVSEEMPDEGRKEQEIFWEECLLNETTTWQPKSGIVLPKSEGQC